MDALDAGRHTTGPKVPTTHPWLWSWFAVFAAATAFTWARVAPEGHKPLEIVQVPLLALGVMAAGIGLSKRFAQSDTASLNEMPRGIRRGALYSLAASHAVLAACVSLWTWAKWTRTADLPGEIGGVAVLWFATVPWAAWSALRLFQHASSEQPLAESLESAALVTQAGITTLLASWALYWGPDQMLAWDSLRLFLAVLGGVALLMAPLVFASSRVRRAAVSALIVLHFCGILTVVAATPPGPWIVGVVYRLVFRSYLDFMYLNNAYRFYSPEPGEASQLWFRLEYRRGDEILSRWEKLPDLDENGNHRYPTSVQYTRRLGLTENVAHAEPAQPMLVITDDGRIELSPVYDLRDQHAVAPIHKDKLGRQQAKNSLKVPYHPDRTITQYQKPNQEGSLLLSAFARHVLAKLHAENPDVDPAKSSVKIYRAKHRILTAQTLVGDPKLPQSDPRDGVYYLPYYQGKFNAMGELVDPGDPFLYWLLPILPNPEHPASVLDCYVFKHAGDRKPDGTPDWQRSRPLKW
jgi:hypothetical protein